MLESILLGANLQQLRAHMAAHREQGWATCAEGLLATLCVCPGQLQPCHTGFVLTSCQSRSSALQDHISWFSFICSDSSLHILRQLYNQCAPRVGPSGDSFWVLTPDLNQSTDTVTCRTMLLFQLWSKKLAALLSWYFWGFFSFFLLQNLRDKPSQSLRITCLVLLTFLNRICLLNQWVSGSKRHTLITCHLVWSTWTRSWIFLNVRIVMFSLYVALIPWKIRFGFFPLGEG